MALFLHLNGNLDTRNAKSCRKTKATDLNQTLFNITGEIVVFFTLLAKHKFIIFPTENDSAVVDIAAHPPCDFPLIKFCTPEATEDLLFLSHCEEDR